MTEDDPESDIDVTVIVDSAGARAFRFNIAWNDTGEWYQCHESQWFPLGQPMFDALHGVLAAIGLESATIPCADTPRLIITQINANGQDK